MLNLGRKVSAHAQPDHRESAKERNAQDKQTAFGALPLRVAGGLVALGQVGALDGVRVLAGAAGRKDAGKRAKRRARHSNSSRAITSCTSRTG